MISKGTNNAVSFALISFLAINPLLSLEYCFKSNDSTSPPLLYTHDLNK